MKKTVLLAMMATVLLMAMPSCGPDEDPLSHFTDGVKVTTADPTYITNKTACCGAEVSADDNGLLIALGVCYSMTSNPTIDNLTVSTHRCSQPFIGLLTNLEPNTEYHVRGYAQYGTEYCYGEEKTFTTFADSIPGASPVTTMPAYDITFDGFYCEVAVKPFGVTDFSVGVCYGTDPNVTVQNSEGYSSSQYVEGNVYLVHCIGYDYYYSLTPNTQYYYRGYVSYYDDNYERHFFYGEILSFTTPDIPLVIELHTYHPYYSWYNNSIEVQGYLSCNKPEVVNEVGFCYSNTNEYPQYESDLYVTAGTPTGTWYDFERTIYNLSANTKYYFRTYARCLNDSICYGNVESVDTW